LEFPWRERRKALSNRRFREAGVYDNSSARRNIGGNSVAPQHYHAPPGTENATLVEAMAEDAVENSPDARKHVYGALLDATLLFLVDSLPPGVPNGGLIRGATDLVFPCGKKDTGETYTTVFTGEDSLRAWDPKLPFVRMRAQTLFRMIQELGLDEVWINLFRDGHPIKPGGWLSRRELDLLAAGKVPERIGTDHAVLKVADSDKVDLIAPKSPLPPEVEAAIIAFSRDIREVWELALFQISINGEVGHHAISLGLDPAAFPSQVESIVPKLMASIQPLLGDREVLDILPYAVPNAAFSENGTFIYRRG
jgi:hypothetical protein